MNSNLTPDPSAESAASSDATHRRANWVHFEVAEQSEIWSEVQGLSRGLAKSVTELCQHVAPGPDGDVLVSIALASDAEVQRLNRDFRSQDKPTNVLSFPMPSGVSGDQLREDGQPLPIGDVVLAFETISSEARQAGVAVLDHVCHLIIHGILHLLGYDHQNDAEASKMEQLEIDILAGLGIDNPYRENLSDEPEC
jgi:probable rRNA maturation factor